MDTNGRGERVLTHSTLCTVDCVTVEYTVRYVHTYTYSIVYNAGPYGTQALVWSKSLRRVRAPERTTNESFACCRQEVTKCMDITAIWYLNYCTNPTETFGPHEYENGQGKAGEGWEREIGIPYTVSHLTSSHTVLPYISLRG